MPLYLISVFLTGWTFAGNLRENNAPVSGRTKIVNWDIAGRLQRDLAGFREKMCRYLTGEKGHANNW